MNNVNRTASEMAYVRDDDSDEIDLMQLACSIVNRWKLCVSFCAAVTLIAFGYCYTKTPVYQATATLFVSPGETKVVSQTATSLSAVSSMDRRTFMSTEVASVQSGVVVRQLFDEFNLWARPEYQKSVDPVSSFVKSALDVTQTPNTSHIQISVKTTDPKLSADLANGLSKIYIEKQVNRAMSLTDRARNTVAAELEKNLKQLDAMSEEVVVFRESRNYIPGTVGRLQAYLNRLDEGVIQARLGFTRQFGVDTVKLASSLEKERVEVEKALVNAIKNEEEYQKIIYRHNLAQNEYRSLVSRLADLDLVLRTKSGVNGVFEMVEEARVPTEKFAPKTLKICGIAFLGSAFFIMLFCIFLDLFDWAAWKKMLAESKKKD